MAFTLVADIFAKVDGAITSMVSANVATIISDVTPSDCHLSDNQADGSGDVLSV
ncbi:hypothetical protein [Escherichia coli]|uniref:hypothetical protein n=1 Tax=Escherichia coli TaxID=562 RepID=UPI00201FA440|nr:hypothetical protein [Escherichia coli]